MTTPISATDRALAKMFSGLDESDWLEVDLKLNREKTDPVVAQSKIDALTNDEAMMRRLLREVG